MQSGELQRPIQESCPDWGRFLVSVMDHVATKSQTRREDPGASKHGSELLDYRNALFQSCLESSSLDPGFYQLEAPVGTGKTLASLAFAVSHAKAHSLDRIIYAIPFTSIVDQTANEFRALTKAMGPNFLIEHHSNLVESNDTTENCFLKIGMLHWLLRQMFSCLKACFRIARAIVVNCIVFHDRF